VGIELIILVLTSTAGSGFATGFEFTGSEFA
jgi:hypothetical protein